MTWFKVDDRLHSHTKTMKAGAAAMGLWVLAGSWSADQLTDGWVPEYAARRLDPDAADLATRLVSAGYWTTGTVDGEDGWQFVNWSDYQPTKAQVETKRDEAKARMRRVRERGGDVRANSARSSSSVTPTPTRPDPTPSKTSRKRDGVSDKDPNWQALWAAYPRKVGKGAARTAYAKALRITDHATLLAAVHRYATAVKGSEPQFIAHPATWLNQERWADELAQPESSGAVSVDQAERNRRMREASEAKGGDR